MHVVFSSKLDIQVNTLFLHFLHENRVSVTVLLRELDKNNLNNTNLQTRLSMMNVSSENM